MCLQKQLTKELAKKLKIKKNSRKIPLGKGVPPKITLKMDRPTSSRVQIVRCTRVDLSPKPEGVVVLAAKFVCTVLGLEDK
jgi:hypothetical protein